MSNLKFATTHNLVVFLEKPKQSDGFVEIIDFLNASSIRYALTVNPTIYTSCIKQFWAIAKVKTVNGEVQIQALVDGKKVIIIEASVRRDLQLADENGAECLPSATIFAELERMGAKTTAWNKFSSTVASAIICLATNKKFNFSKYIFDNMVKNLEGGVKFLMYPRFVQVFLDKQVCDMTTHNRTYDAPCHTKKIFANMNRERKGFSRRVTPLFPTMMKKQPKRKQRKDTEVPQPSDSTKKISDEAPNEENVTTTSNDPLLSGEDRLQLNELMDLCTKPQQRVLDLENAKTAQDSVIASLKKRVKKLERRNKSRTSGLKRLRKLGRSAIIISSKDEGLDAQEDASKQGRRIIDINADAEVTLIDETQERNDDNLMFDTCILDKQEVEVEKVVSTAEVKVTTASVTTTTVDELTMDETLIEIKVAKPKAVTTAAITTTTAVTRPKARGAKDKGKAKMVEPEKPLKKKDQIVLDKEVAQKLQAQLDVELEKEEKLAKQREEDANIAEWDDVQAMMDADYELAARLQA
ncbi:hypothetical protein Tco_1455679 [Tanacetum coccineum]